MEDSPLQPLTSRTPARLLWFLVVVALSVALARIAVWLQNANFAAVGVFPVILGGAVGFFAVWLAHRFAIRNRTAMISAAMLAALLLAMAEHGFFYLDYRSNFAAAIHSNPKAQLMLALEGDQFQPASFGRFMSAEAPAKWPLWIADAGAMIAVAAIAAGLMSRTTPAAQTQADANLSAITSGPATLNPKP
jgi:hypothetical protein